MPDQPTISATLPPARDMPDGCFHCGAPCPEPAFAWHGKAFCCFGCQTVFTLLHENGLAQFYELNSRPGVRVRETAAAARWTFLDDPLVQEKLLDYADKSQAKVTLHLPAIHCVACVWLLENLFKLHPGVGQSLVNFSRREAAITFAPDRIKLSELVALLVSIGYEPELTLGALEQSGGSPRHQKEWLQIGLAGFVFGNIMLMSLPFYFGLDRLSGPWFARLAGWIGLVLALPVVTYSASDYWRAAWLGVRQRRITMEVPIALGLAALYAASVYEVARQRGPGYGDSLCGLIFFLLCGRLFQKKTHERLTFDRDYKGFFPLSVVRLKKSQPPARHDDRIAEGQRAGPETGVPEEETVAISQLQTGDRLRLRNGELLPADARLVSGAACLDYSFVSGESEPVVCRAGDHLYAGGRQVGGIIEVETIKPVAQSYLATLWDDEAFRKPRDHDLDSLTNRFSKHFTRVVLGVALAAAAGWLFQDAAKALKVFISVLIVACPCALALAAPLTQGTAQRLLARLKIFLKSGLVVERLTGVNTIVLDKTGTLTTAVAGGAEFTGAKSGETNLTADEAAWIGSLARHSTHPHSRRIAKSLSSGVLPVNGFKETPGCGIEGEVAGHQLRLGSRTWLEPCGTAGASSLHGSVFVAIDGIVRGAFTLENSLRPEVARLISELGGRFELALLSGDNEREAARFKNLLGGRATLKFNQSPADKLHFIRELQRRGRRVMMVGDGLNDAGALKQADVGVAVVEQAGVFSPASDVILDAAQLPQLARVLQFSRQSARVVRAAFAISALYNLAGVSIAAAGLLSPVICAILMPLSSVTVVVFTTGMTIWLGKKLKVGELRVESSGRRVAQLSTLNSQRPSENSKGQPPSPRHPHAHFPPLFEDEQEQEQEDDLLGRNFQTSSQLIETEAA